jgi:Zn-dependent M28 family amino/carboxypeptidase
VVLFTNEPPSSDEKFFKGRALTYYGRWTYKYEEAARRGAAAALIIHTTPTASYGWQVVRANGRPQPQVRRKPGEPALAFAGWITEQAGAQLASLAGEKLEDWLKAADTPGFRARPLGKLRIRGSFRFRLEDIETENVVGKVRGSDPRLAEEAVVFSAHWDHLGLGEPVNGDNIYNGAIDNATGVAGVLEIAEQFTVQSPKPERSVIFLLVTLEESGLLGSAYYAAHPVVPLAKTVAVINIDAMPVVGLTHDMVVVGLGNSELEDILRPITDKQGRVLVEESSPEKGQFFRSDHFSFAKAGVPALYVKGGVDNIENGREYGLKMLEDYTTNRYHKASDNFDPTWDLRGIVQDLNALYGVGKILSLDDAWPNYRKGNAFRAVRDASRGTP